MVPCPIDFNFNYNNPGNLVLPLILVFSRCLCRLAVERKQRTLFNLFDRNCETIGSRCTQTDKVTVTSAVKEGPARRGPDEVNDGVTTDAYKSS